MLKEESSQKEGGIENDDKQACPEKLHWKLVQWSGGKRQEPHLAKSARVPEAES